MWRRSPKYRLCLWLIRWFGDRIPILPVRAVYWLAMQMKGGITYVQKQ